MLTDVLTPHNRWDLLSGYPRQRPTVTVIVTHFEQHHLLARMAKALRNQTLPPSQVVLADDGSAVTPVFAVPDVETLVVAQPDQGFRAGTVRNLAARHSTGEVLVFLDADTVPEPGYLEEAVRHIVLCPDVLAVGRRRHASFTGLADDAQPDAANALTEPAWLQDGYAASENLLHSDGRSFRFVIGAVLSCRRDLFFDLAGFDERFVGYGGEDWDFAYRAWNAGAVLVHERAAVAWHDGPDWGARGEGTEVMDLQSARLAAVIPEPATRGAPMPGGIFDVLATVSAGGDFGRVVRTVHSLLRQSHRDLGVRLPVDDERLLEAYAGIVRTDQWTEDQLRRARVRIDVHGPLPASAVHQAVELIAGADLGRVDLVREGELLGVAWSTRVVGRARRWASRFGFDEVLGSAFGRERLSLCADRDHHRTLAGFFASWP
ncbi:glycosyltransferase [Amycolatopsis sp. WQ 127309]|uniref:glycosyltransferase n=1 Tax=Amycolatopsis sp. WQ 127309 TaxID=2932773 RepID=UPI001FF43068|nr:glycosyltransferase [Amycolatopsis sp. WQ 127309]UOZ04898.1 glycosyltransferase [Amycolatopsis sp. WQ 127309]